MDYYVMLQAHIAEARNVDALDMLLIPANVELKRESGERLRAGYLPRTGHGTWMSS